jgi:hypothetical protein
MPQTDSAVSLLSGVHRRDVRELTRGPAPPAPSPGPLGLAAQVVARWMHDPSFGRRRAHARAAPRAAAKGSASTRWWPASAATCARAPCWTNCCAWAWCRTPAAGITLEGSALPRAQGFEEISWLCANLHDHAAAAVANLQGEANFLEQAVFVDQISAESALLLQRTAKAAWKQAFHQVMQQAQTRFDGDAPLPAAERGHRARFGVYFYSEREDRLRAWRGWHRHRCDHRVAGLLWRVQHTAVQQ